MIENLKNSQDITTLQYEDKTIHLVGTAHISQESVDLVGQSIREIKPDCVCVELDEKRYESLKQKQRWENLNLRQIIKEKQLSTLMSNIILSSYQKKMGAQLGVKPGSELLEATEVAQEQGCKMTLVDRDIRITLKRAWRKTPFFKKIVLGSTLFSSVFENTEVSEDSLREMRQKDALSGMMDEMGDGMPQFKEVLIDERDAYMVEKILQAPGKNILAVVGAGHKPGMIHRFNEKIKASIAELEEIPPASTWGKLLAWAIPMWIIFGLSYLFFVDFETAKAGLNVWVLANAIPTAIGAAIAFGHPLTIIAGAIAAPITSLSPMIGAAMVTAFVQTMLVPPRVKDFEEVQDYFVFGTMMWRNRLTRVFLCAILPGIGSAIGSFIGAADLIQRFLK